MFKEVITVYYENHMKTINTLCEQSAELQIVKADGTSLPLGFKGLTI
jgi:hypothetical protein